MFSNRVNGVQHVSMIPSGSATCLPTGLERLVARTLPTGSRQCGGARG